MKILASHDLSSLSASLQSFEMSKTGILSPESTGELSTEPAELTTERVTRSRSAVKMRRTEPLPSGTWISRSTKKSGDGASRSDVQEKVGKWLGLFSLVQVSEMPVLTEDESRLITLALEHRELLRDYPITRSEVVRIATEHMEMTSEQQRIPANEEPCKCILHSSSSGIEPALLAVLKNLMTCSSELGGEFRSGNLTNLTLHLLTYIVKTKAGLENIQIQAEIKSSAQTAGSKVVANFGSGHHSVTIEATPDFYIRNQSPIVYLTIGEVESIGTVDSEVQLAIGTLGMLARRRTTMISAILMNRNFDCYIYLGTCAWDENGDYGRVTFKKVNRSSGYQLENPEQLELFSRAVVAVVKLMQQNTVPL